MPRELQQKLKFHFNKLRKKIKEEYEKLPCVRASRTPLESKYFLKASFFASFSCKISTRWWKYNENKPNSVEVMNGSATGHYTI